MSNKTFVFDKCRTVPVNRYQGSLIASGFFLKTAKNPNLNLELAYKAEGAQNYRTIFNYKNLDVCAIFKTPALLKLDIMTYCKRFLPALCHKCPFRADEHFDVNVSVKVEDYICTIKNGQKNANLNVLAW
jgi:hypothetical protein